MSVRSIWLVGTLASHARGKVIAEAVGASPVADFPTDHGMGVAFGSEFQELDAAAQLNWLRWAEVAGRTLLLIPPFKVAVNTQPTSWQIRRPQKVESAAADTLGGLLAGEVRHEITGMLQVAVEVGGTWKSGGVHSAYYRKHRHSGLFAATCLPLWSLAVLDHRDVVQHWLNILGDLGGQAAPRELVEEQSEMFHPKADHFALMLHLCERAYTSSQEALNRLADSPVFAIPAAAAQMYLQELESAGLVSNATLTDQGRSVLLESPYAVYAAAMKRTRS